MSQRIRMIVPKRYRKAKGVAIDKRSIGTLWIQGVPYTYNPELVYQNPVTVDQINEDNEKKKKRRVIIIRRR